MKLSVKILMMSLFSTLALAAPPKGGGARAKALKTADQASITEALSESGIEGVDSKNLVSALDKNIVTLKQVNNLLALKGSDIVGASKLADSVIKMAAAQAVYGQTELIKGDLAKIEDATKRAVELAILIQNGSALNATSLTAIVEVAAEGFANGADILTLKVSLEDAIKKNAKEDALADNEDVLDAFAKCKS